MASTLAHFERRFHIVLPKVVLELKEVFECILVIRIDRDPFAALSGRTYRVQTNCDLTLQMPPNGLGCQLNRCRLAFLCGTEIIMTSALGVRPHGLHGVGSAIDE